MNQGFTETLVIHKNKRTAPQKIDTSFCPKIEILRHKLTMPSQLPNITRLSQVYPQQSNKLTKKKRKIRTYKKRNKQKMQESKKNGGKRK